MSSLTVGDLNAPNPGLNSPFIFLSTKGGLKVAQDQERKNKKLFTIVSS